MVLTILYHNTITDTIYDISDLVSSIDINSQFDEQPTSVTIKLINRDKMSLPSGSILSVKADQLPLFLGYQFKREGGDDVQETLTFYDQLRYLQFKDTLVLGEKTIGELFSQLCNYKGLKHRVVNNVTNYRLPMKIYENKTIYSMLQDMLDEVFIATGTKLLIWDNFGILELRDVTTLKAKLFFGDGSLLTGYSFTQSIDDETFNIIKLIRENKETGKMEEVVEMSRPTIKLWGQLQYHAKVDEGVGDLRTHARNLLVVHNREEKTLELDTIGDFRVRAGIGIIVHVGGVKDIFGGAKYYIVESCTHTVEETHTMKLKLRII